jgi:feruloyl-CoA synthase
MAADALSWEPDPFRTDCVRREDGALLLRPVAALGEYPKRLTDCLTHWARAAPQRPFVARRTRGGEWQSVTYGQMHERVQRIAAGLAARSLSPERPILILSGNSIEHLELALAAMWIGVPYCPVSPAYSQASADLGRLRYVLGLMTPGLVAAFDTRAFDRALRTVAPDVEVVGDEETASRAVTPFAALEGQPTQQAHDAHASTGAGTIAKFLLTSGSTGNPKAVITTQRMLCSNALMLRQPMPFLADEPPVLVDWLPWNHTFGGSHNVGLVLFNGGALYIDDGRPTPAGIHETVRNLREISPTVYFNVPKGFELLAHALHDDAALRRRFFARLRAYFFAGASLSQHTWDALDGASLKERGAKTPMLSGLGATETGPSVTFTTPAMGRAGVIGLPANGNEVKLAPCEDKLEIRVRSPSVTPGYWREPALTAAAFDEEGFYRMGDAVRLLDQDEPTRGLEFDGRIAEDFKLANGTWVSVGPLRAELIAALSPVAQDVVIAGLDCDFLAALVIPDVWACSQMLQLSADATHAQLATHASLLGWIGQRLAEHAKCNPASTRCVRRAQVLPSAPALDAGEITDKGSINQRAVLRQRSDCIAAMYSPQPPACVIEVAAA